MNADDRYVVISADCHGGGEIHEYRDFLARKYHDEFDAWVDGYQIMFPDLLGDLGKRNWDSDRRQRDLEADGIAAEVIFPNTIPPFFPAARSSRRSHPPTRDDHELRWAGLQAHNRWLADFCARTGSARGRRADHVARRRRVGRGDPLGEGERSERWDPPPGCASGHRAAAAAPQALRPDLDGVRRARACRSTTTVGARARHAAPSRKTS